MFIQLRQNERWTKLKYPGIIEDAYLISDYGRIFSKIKDRIIVPAMHVQGYKHITLIGTDKKYKKVLVHRLVAWHYVDGFDRLRRFVNHEDGIKVNNYYKNLKWVTHQENVDHSVRTGLNKSGIIFKEKYKGSGNPNFKYPDIIIERMCYLLEQGYSSKVITPMILREYPERNFKFKSVHKYIQTKIKSRLYRTDISSRYTF